MVQTLAASGHLTTSPSDPHRDNSFPRPSSWPCRRDFFRSTLRRHSAALQAAGIARAGLKTRVQLQHLPINLRGQKAQLDYGVQLESRRSAAEQVLGRLYFWPTIGLTLLRSWRDGRGLWCEAGGKHFGASQHGMVERHLLQVRDGCTSPVVLTAWRGRGGTLIDQFPDVLTLVQKPPN